MAETLVFAVCVTCAWAVLAIVIPWMVRITVLYALHNIRDDVYKAAESFPAARGTRLYRITEYLITMAIHTVRERHYSEALGYASAMLSENPQVSVEGRERATALVAICTREAQEIFTGQSGKDALNVLMYSPRYAACLTLLRAITATPLSMFVLFVVMIFKFVLRVLQKSLMSADSGIEIIANAVPRVGNSVPQGTLERLRLASSIRPSLFPRHQALS